MVPGDLKNMVMSSPGKKMGVYPENDHGPKLAQFNWYHVRGSKWIMICIYISTCKPIPLFFPKRTSLMRMGPTKLDIPGMKHHETMLNHQFLRWIIWKISISLHFTSSCWVHQIQHQRLLPSKYWSITCFYQQMITHVFKDNSTAICWCLPTSNLTWGTGKSNFFMGKSSD